MYRHISNPPQESLFVQEQIKGTKKTESLKIIPSLSFLVKGFFYVAKCFNITVDELKQLNSELEAREGLHNG